MSVYFEWTEDMSVGESTIDAQHQKLLAQVNKIIDAMVFGSGSIEVVEALNFFDQYINEHLAYEEAYMKRRGYFGLNDHIKKHEEFRKKYEDFHTKLKSGIVPDEILVEMERFLGDWWVGHIGHEDKKYYEVLGRS